MIYAMAAEQALKRRRFSKSKVSEHRHWRTEFIGTRSASGVQNTPQAYLIEMNANEPLRSHFHEVDQFQVFVAGMGTMGRNNEPSHPIALHYADHHTAYGPINAGAQGFSYFTLRARTDSGAVFIDEKGYREKLKPSKRRHYLLNVALSTEPVLANRTSVSLEPLAELDAQSDGLAAFVLRSGPRLKVSGPDPRSSGGQYYLVLSGSLEQGGASYGSWSTIFVEPDGPALEICSGERGTEVLIMQYPVPTPC